MNFGGFSWKRLLGISAAKSRLSRSIGIPFTRSGRQRKLGAAFGCTMTIIGAMLITISVLAVAATR